MKKFLFIFILALTLISTLLIKWQWHAYSSSSQEKRIQDANQKIQIVAGSKEIKITQTFSGLDSKREVELIVPTSVTVWDCQTNAGNGCSSKDKNPLTFLPKQGVIQLHYSMEMNRKQTSKLFLNWKIDLKDVNIQHTSISIADSINLKSTWIAGLPLKGKKTLDIIRFFSFSGLGNFNSLYYEDKILPHVQIIDSLAIYNTREIKQKPEMKHYHKLQNKPFTAIVISNEQPYTSDDMLIVNHGLSVESLEKLLITSYFQKKFVNSNRVKWLVDLLVANFYQQPPTDKKSIKVNEALIKNLSVEQRLELLKLINDSPSKLTSKNIDEMLSHIKGMETTFFQKNATNSSYAPLYFHKVLSMTANTEESTSLKLILKDGKTFFPFETTVSLLGYKLKFTKDEIHLKKGADAYIIYPLENLFILNGQEYGFLENPLTKIDGKYYIEERWLQPFLKVSLEEEAGKIVVKENNK